MTKKTSGERSAKVAKAGKRHGMIVYPLPPSRDKQVAHEQGERQFIAKRQQYTERSAVKWDEKRQRFINKIVHVPVDYTYDENRGRLVRSPVTKDKRNRE